MEKEFTATVYIVSDLKVLLVHHKKFGFWMPPGGHIEANETPPEAAKREALEETGLEIEFITDENLWVEKEYARSFERPYLCMLQDVPPQGDRPAHQHVDFIYFAHPIGGAIGCNLAESHAIRWFDIEEIFDMEPSKEIFSDTLDVLNAFFSPLPLNN